MLRRRDFYPSEISQVIPNGVGVRMEDLSLGRVSDWILVRIQQDNFKRAWVICANGGYSQPGSYISYSQSLLIFLGLAVHVVASQQ